MTLDEVRASADVVHDNANLGAAVASGSFRTMGMLVVPCSMKTVAGIAHGFSNNLLLRAADVMLKEGRPLVLMPRNPLEHHPSAQPAGRGRGRGRHRAAHGHLHGPATIADMNRHLLGKALGRMNIDLPGMRRWGEEE